MKQIPRHQKIVDLVIKQGYVSTEELVERFDVSPQTIRRDLNELADNNKIRRYHGGATIPLSSENTSYSTRKTLNFNEKDLIAEQLVKNIPNGASLFIDIGTTPESIARALNKNHKQLRVVTNNVNVATILLANPEIKVILAGGEVRTRDGGIVGEATLDFVKQFSLDFGILGISGIGLDGSLLDFDYNEVRVKQAIIDNSRSIFLAIDHSKFGRNAMVKLGNISQAHMVFTNQKPPEEILNILNDLSIPLEVIDPS
ncbi:DeoR/GlpR family transcriptional regulator [Vibrio gallicus]|uniref:DeoR/GlpR family transcriptional regulator n=1 Tax=Vibrio gallicus TaxID=190897 RepID=UPI0021C37D8B|nr:DeoR/GlpR family transcriptional regulator [Vibrio gallicus]